MLRHRSIQTSIAACVLLAGGSAIATVPWPLWVAWGVLSAVAVTQAVRERREVAA